MIRKGSRRLEEGRRALLEEKSNQTFAQGLLAPINRTPTAVRRLLIHVGNNLEGQDALITSSRQMFDHSQIECGASLPPSFLLRVTSRSLSVSVRVVVLFSGQLSTKNNKIKSEGRLNMNGWAYIKFLKFLDLLFLPFIFFILIKYREINTVKFLDLLDYKLNNQSIELEFFTPYSIIRIFLNKI